MVEPIVLVMVEPIAVAILEPFLIVYQGLTAHVMDVVRVTVKEKLIVDVILEQELVIVRAELTTVALAEPPVLVIIEQVLVIVLVDAQLIMKVYFNRE